MVSNLDIDILLSYKNKEKLDLSKTFIYKTEFDNSIYNLRSFIKKSFNSLKNTNDGLNNYELLVVNKMKLNLSSLLVNNFELSLYLKFLITR